MFRESRFDKSQSILAATETVEPPTTRLDPFELSGNALEALFEELISTGAIDCT